ncbi:MAG: sugar transferase [Clostridia bacterium]|nr:sugar transferase [Clostridia bacterium]
MAETTTPHRFLVKWRHLFQSVLKLLLLAGDTYAFIFCVDRWYPATDFHFWGYVMFAVLYVIVLLAFINMYRCFSIGTLRKRELVIGAFIAISLTNLVNYFVICLLSKYIVSVLYLGFICCCQIVYSALLLLAANFLFFRLRPSRDALVICAEDRHDADTLRKFDYLRESYHVQEVVSESDPRELLYEKLEKCSTVVCGSVDLALRSELVKYCFEKNKRMFVMPQPDDIILHSSHEVFVGDSMMYLCRNRTFTLEQLIIKRLIDIVASLFGIVLTGPLMLLTALAIKLQDGGPVFFKQVRYTRNCKKFTLIKFRSMIVDAEKDGARFTTDHDDRITPVGRFIRRTRLDELPQFFNILAGDMSLVGPRAERIENVEYYCKLMPEFRYRMKVKAGLTGYAQIYGKYNTTYEDKLKMDLMYIENCSIMEDIQLLFQTVRVLFIPDSTEGFVTTTLDGLGKTDEQDTEKHSL